MKGILIFLFSSVFSISVSFCQQDTIITRSGERIICSIQKETQTNVTVLIQNDSIEYTNIIPKSYINDIRHGFTQPHYSRYWRDAGFIFTIDLLIPSAGVEFRLADYSTLVVSYQYQPGPGLIIHKKNEEAWKTNMVHQFIAAPRFYTNIRYREYKGRNTYKFSGTYLSTLVMVTLPSEYNERMVTIGPLYGIQRNFAKIGHFSMDIGFGFISSKELTAFGILGNVSFGFAF